MRRVVFIIEHGDDNSVETGNLRQSDKASFLYPWSEAVRARLKVIKFIFRQHLNFIILYYKEGIQAHCGIWRFSLAPTNRILLKSIAPGQGAKLLVYFKVPKETEVQEPLEHSAAQ